LYWIRYQNQIYFNPSLYWSNDIDNRRFIKPDIQNQFIVHSHLHLKREKWDFASGLTASFAYAAVPEVGYKKSIMELRPIIEASHEQPFGRMSIHQRVRVDNRFFESDPELSIFKESEFVMRFRYRLQLRATLMKDEQDTPVLNLRVADEIMVNDRKNFYDQNRIYVTSEYVASKKLSFEAGYIYIDQQRYGRDEFFSRNVLRFSIVHRIFIQ
jgi:hypothetical protein